MKTALALLVPVVLAACAAMPAVRPVASHTEPQLSAFERDYRAGKDHFAGGRIGLALVMFERALQQDSGSVAALNAIGAVYDELHRPDAARQYYMRALALEPDSADTLNNLAISAMLAGDDANARTLLARATALDPRNAIILANAAALAREAEQAIAEAAPQDGPTLERTGRAEVTLTIAE